MLKLGPYFTCFCSRNVQRSNIELVKVLAVILEGFILFEHFLIFSYFNWQVAVGNWNVTALIRRSSSFCFFAALNCSCLGFNALLALLTKEGGIKGIKSKKGAINCCYETNISSPILMSCVYSFSRDMN